METPNFLPQINTALLPVVGDEFEIRFDNRVSRKARYVEVALDGRTITLLQQQVRVAGQSQSAKCRAIILRTSPWRSIDVSVDAEARLAKVRARSRLIFAGELNVV